MRPEKVAKLVEGARIKAWGQRSGWERLGLYRGESSSKRSPLTSFIPISEGGGEGQVGGGQRHNSVCCGA